MSRYELWVGYLLSSLFGYISQALVFHRDGEMMYVTDLRMEKRRLMLPT